MSWRDRKDLLTYQRDHAMRCARSCRAKGRPDEWVSQWVQLARCYSAEVARMVAKMRRAAA